MLWPCVMTFLYNYDTSDCSGVPSLAQIFTDKCLETTDNKYAQYVCIDGVPYAKKCPITDTTCSSAACALVAVPTTCTEVSGTSSYMSACWNWSTSGSSSSSSAVSIALLLVSAAVALLPGAASF
eukprot:Unigene14354_Nuclearia_a/m.43314 Unigene14354_Nuclearia_a/g.43314  ORF Unigene14354_Nuclearia_a/g.43314 Unigene14354_Nuclearia_a/m.43314 type:complete len:125 (-) Unigene14354_Nuclearia_a:160-534(-)